MNYKTVLLGCFIGLGLSTVSAKPSWITPLTNRQHPFYSYKGEIFVALLMPKTAQLKIAVLQRQIQWCLGKRAFSPTPLSHLHVTLQLIGQSTTAQDLKVLHRYLQRVAQRHRKWDFAQHLEQARLSLSSEGIVKLILPYSARLTKLAQDIRQSLKKQGIAISSRFDFPSKAHITIGIVQKKASKFYVSKIKKCIKAHSITPARTMKIHHFPIKNFALLKSNRPALKRDYALLSTYSL